VLIHLSPSFLSFSFSFSFSFCHNIVSKFDHCSLPLTLGSINHFELMRTSYNLLRSRFRRCHHHAAAYHSLAVVYVKPDHRPPPILPSFPHPSKPKQFLLLAFNAHRFPCHRSMFTCYSTFIVSLSYLTWIRWFVHVFLGFFTRAKTAQNIEFNDRHRFRRFI